MDRGEYVCVGRNDYGTVNKIIDLIVLSKKMIDFFHQIQSKSQGKLISFSFILWLIATS